MAGSQEDEYSVALQQLEAVLDDDSKDAIQLPLPLLKKITTNFSQDEKIGRGSFGTVYKGRLPGGKVVAVKKVDTSKTTDDATLLENELECMKKAKHKNVLRLLGYYRKQQPKNVLILCSEYAPNGSLSSYLKADIFCRYQWSTRYRIILGICEGLDYLHTTQPMAIVHRDLKPENILLHHNMVPKIADFGLSKLVDVDKSRNPTFGGRGTPEYRAPEIILRQEFTTKSDIYSLGYVILDLLVGRDKYMKFLWDRKVRRYLKLNKVLDIWMESFKPRGPKNDIRKQVGVCAAIAMQCLHVLDPNFVNRYMANDNDENGPLTTNYEQGSSSSSNFLPTVYEMADRSKDRPSATEIVQWLRATENWPLSLSQKLQLTLSTEAEVLDIYPRVLCFHFGEDEASSWCVLNLTNKSKDRYVGFWIETEQGIIDCKYDGHIVDPDTTKAVIAELHSVEIEREGHRSPVRVVSVDTGRVNILTITLTKEQVPIAEEIRTTRHTANECFQILRGDVHVHEALLPVVVCPLTPRGQLAPAPARVSKIMEDVHPTKPWILMSDDMTGVVSIWNYQTKTEEKFELGYANPRTSKFIPGPGGGEQRMVISYDTDGIIHVISWNTNGGDTEITKTLSRPNKEEAADVRIMSVAVHPDPEEPLLLWADAQGVLSLQSWQGQAYIRTFQGALGAQEITQVKFHPKDKNSIIIACGRTIMVQKINSFSIRPTTPIIVGQQRGNECRPGGIAASFFGFDFPYTDSDRQHIAILREGGVEIWDLQEGHKVRELSFDRGAFEATAIACHPIHPLIVLGTRCKLKEAVTIFVYNSKDYRVQKMITYTAGSAIQEFGFSKRLVVGYARRRHSSNRDVDVLDMDMLAGLQ